MNGALWSIEAGRHGKRLDQTIEAPRECGELNMDGLSKSRLERMHRVLSGYVERGELPGLVALVGRHGDVHAEALGTMSFGDPAPMRRDTIFRIASLTKLVTAVTAMILVEECRLRLDE